MCLIKITKPFPLQEKDPRNYIGWRFFSQGHTPNIFYSPFQNATFIRGQRKKETEGLAIYGHYITYPSGYHIFPTKHEAMLALKISPELRDCKNLILGRVSFADAQTYGIDNCGVRCVVARELTLLDTREIPSSTKLFNFDRSISGLRFYYHLCREWQKQVTEPMMEGREPASKFTIGSQVFARRHKDGHYVFNRQYLTTMGEK